MQNNFYCGYKVLETLHSSRRFVICKAIDREGKTVVLKIAGSDFLHNHAEDVDRYYRTAEAMRSVTVRYPSPHLVHVLDVVRTEKSFFIVMEYVEGVSLAKTLPHLSIPRNQSDLDEIENQLYDIVRAISDYGFRPAAIESSNVMVTPADKVVLLNYINLYAHTGDISCGHIVDEFMDECYRSISGFDVDEEERPHPPYPSGEYDPYETDPSCGYATEKPSSRIKPEIIALGVIAILSFIIILLLFLMRNVENTNTVGYIDAEETVIDTPMANVLHPYREGNLYGYKNDAGEVVVHPQYNYAEEFSEGRAVVKRLGSREECGYIDCSGEEVIPLRYTHAEPFHNGEAVVEINYKNKKYVIDLEGNTREEETLGRYRD
jgi:hypothetical protein